MKEEKKTVLVEVDKEEDSKEANKENIYPVHKYGGSNV